MEILIVIIVGALVYFIAKALMPNKYRCNHCQSPNNHIKDAKSEDFSHTKFAHTTKDGKKDRRYNQSGTKVYDLVFDCVDCGKEFEIASNIYVGSHVDRTVQKMAKDNPEFAKTLGRKRISKEEVDRNLMKILDEKGLMSPTKDAKRWEKAVRYGIVECEFCGKIEEGEHEACFD